MPDERLHRGPHPEDRLLFAADTHTRLQSAVADLSWLLSRGYAQVSALKIVGDRYALQQRQRTAVARCACSDEARANRQQSRVAAGELAGQTLLIDGYNVLTTIEAVLAGGVILCARDGCYRDMASVHGTWRKVEETIPAVELLGIFLTHCAVGQAVWYLDSPVSNSGRLKTLLREIAASRSWPWTIELVPNPDRILADAKELIATADSAILDGCQRWVNLAREVVERHVPTAKIVVM